MCFIKEQTLTYNPTFYMTALCNVAHPDILIFFYLFIYLFIDDEEGNGLAVGCTACRRYFVDSLGLFDDKYCHLLEKYKETLLKKEEKKCQV